MNQVISKFVSNTTYNGQLKAHDSVANHLLAGLNPQQKKGEKSVKSEKQLRKSILMNPFIYIDTNHTCPEEKNTGMNHTVCYFLVL